MYQIKQIPEDFVVEEIPKELHIGQGDYTYFILEKKNWNTRDAIKAISARLKMKEKYFNIAGIKDKKAITKQYVSAYKVNRKRLENLKIKDLKITILGQGKERLKLGQSEGNKFVITVRTLEKKGNSISFIENYYDEQRFSGKNKILGKALVQKEFRKACYTLRLRWEGKDYIGALRKLGKNILRIYTNAYQSYLFNQVLAEYLKTKYKNYFEVDYSQGTFVFSNEKIQNEKLPVIGFLTEFKNREIKNIYERLMKEEKIKKEDFEMREMPEISSEGTERDLFVKIKNFKISYEQEKDKLIAIISFELPPGSYATLVIKKAFKS